jgi:hypothetical protein
MVDASTVVHWKKQLSNSFRLHFQVFPLVWCLYFNLRLHLTVLYCVMNMASFKETCLFIPCTGNVKISLIWVLWCIIIFFCTHIWGFIYTVGVHLTCGSEPLPWNMVCILSHATFLWIHSSDLLVSSHLLLHGMQWCIWLRLCTVSQKVEDLIPSGVIGIFHWLSPFSYTMAQGLP